MDVLELAQRLSPEDQYLLVQELSRNRTEIKNERPEVAVFVCCDDTILSPEEKTETIRRREELETQLTPEKIEAQNKAWENFQNLSRRITENEIQAMEEARKEINQCRLAFL
jgi:hypothetical protein